MSVESCIDKLIVVAERQADVNREVLAAVKNIYAELAEIRDGMVALSNRIEAATRAQVPAGAGDTRPRLVIRRYEQENPS